MDPLIRGKFIFRQNYKQENSEERKYESSETKTLGYLKLKRLKEGFALGKIVANKNQLVFAELVQYLDKRSLSLMMRDAKDNVGEALRKLRAHYTGSRKPRIITL